MQNCKAARFTFDSSRYLAPKFWKEVEQVMTNSVSGPGNTKGQDQYINGPYRRGTNQATPKFAAVLEQEQSADLSKTSRLSDRTALALNTADIYPSPRDEITRNTSVDTSFGMAFTGERIGEDRLTTSPGFRNIDPEEKNFFDSIRPSHYDDNQYQQILEDYDERLSLLDPDNLPRTRSGFQLVTRPQPGKSRSTDTTRPPSFTQNGGNIVRTDYTQSGEVKTYIPVTEWRLVAGAGDAEVGTVYSQQLPWGFRCYLDRGGGSPKQLGYKEGQFQSRVQQYLLRSENISRENYFARW